MRGERDSDATQDLDRRCGQTYIPSYLQPIARKRGVVKGRQGTATVSLSVNPEELKRRGAGESKRMCGPMCA